MKINLETHLISYFHIKWLISKEDFVSWYVAYVRPHLEHVFRVWNPYAKKDVKSLEKESQKFATSLSNWTPKFQCHLTRNRAGNR